MSVLCKGSTEEKVKFSFSVYDIDGDNTIDKQELFIMLRSCLLGAQGNEELGLTEGQLRTMVDATFKEVDENDDGKISLAEYGAMCEARPTILTAFTLSLGGLERGAKRERKRSKSKSGK